MSSTYKGFTCDHWKKECENYEFCCLRIFGEVDIIKRTIPEWTSRKWTCHKDGATKIKVVPVFIYLMRKACVLESKKYVRENRRKNKTLEMVE